MNNEDVWGNDLLKTKTSRSEACQISFKLSERAYSTLSAKNRHHQCPKRKLTQSEECKIEVVDSSALPIENPILNKILGKRAPRPQKLEPSVSINCENEVGSIQNGQDSDNLPAFKSPSKNHLKSRDMMFTSQVSLLASQRHRVPQGFLTSNLQIESRSDTLKVCDITEVCAIVSPPHKRVCLAAIPQAINGDLSDVASTIDLNSNSFGDGCVVGSTLTECSSPSDRFVSDKILSTQDFSTPESLVVSKECPSSLTKSTQPVKQKKLKLDNFVKVNLRKKCFVKGATQFGSKQKRWKNKMFNRNRSRWENDEESRMRFKNNGPRISTVVSKTDEENCGVGVSNPIPDVLSEFVLEFSKKPMCYTSPECEKVTIARSEMNSLIAEGLNVFKIKNLLEWQKAAIEVVLSGESSLVVKPTGSGKSLCYLLPAYIFHKKYQYLTLVISPLISLMQDQVKNLPRGMKGAAFHSGLTEARRKIVMKELQEKKIAVLYISPETLVEGILLKIIPEFPPIAFACIDEVHCVSQWSHNFRPTYFRVCTILRQQLGLSCVLGSTATASLKTMRNIAQILSVKDEFLFYDVSLPTNLKITASRDSHRLQALCDLIENEPFKHFKSILIYCTKRIDCDRVASHLRTYFCEQNFAESYHAGKTACERSKIQKSFMNDTLRVVCATVAFGMGLDKSALRAVVHYNISQSIESYVQEIGRAGRSSDLDAYCHTFLGDSSMFDIFEQERHIYSSFVEPATLREIVDIVFEDSGQFNCHLESEMAVSPHYHYSAIELSRASEFDMKEEVLTTYVSYLEMHSSNIVSVEKTANNWCNVYFYKGYDIDKNFYKECLPIKIALKLSEAGGKFAYRKGNKLRFQLTAIANHCDLSISQINYRLFMCQTKDLGIKVHFDGRSIIYRVLCSSDTEKQLSEMTDYILDRSKEHVKNQLSSLHSLYNEILLPISEKSAMTSILKANSDRDINSAAIECIATYFNTDLKPQGSSQLVSEEITEQEEHVVRQTVRAFLSLYYEMGASGLVICRILQGIDSPQYPAQTWCTVARFWKSCVTMSFNRLLKICNEEVIKS